jgi:hypothetical protein
MLKGLGSAFDEANFGHQRTLNLRESLPSADQARSRAEAWLRMHQVMRSENVLVITGRGNQSVDGIGVIKEAIMGLLHSLRRRGVVTSWAEHTPGSIVVTLAPVSTLLGTPKRNRVEESNDRQQPVLLSPSFAGLDKETVSLLRQVAIRTIESLGISKTELFVKDEMQKTFATLSKTLPATAGREATLRRALRSALDDLEE